MSFERLRARIKTARRCGVVHVESRHRTAIGAESLDDRDASDALAIALGLQALGEAWVALEQARACQVASDVLWHDLAYRFEIMDRLQAEELSRDFLTHFAPDARFFSNFASMGAEVEVLENGWNPLTDATFDTGIVVVDQNRVGILWVEDED